MTLIIEYAFTFRENMVNGNMLKALTDTQLSALGVVNKFHRIRLLYDISKLSLDEDAGLRWRRGLMGPNTPKWSQPEGNNIQMVERRELVEITPLASGEFARVYSAQWRKQHVVIKVPKQRPGGDEWSELNTYLHVVPHPNILAFIGVANFEGKICLVTRKMSHSLKVSFCTCLSFSHPGNPDNLYDNPANINFHMIHL